MQHQSSNTILIVDDNVGARRSIEALLANGRYHLLLASSGLEALEMAQAHHPDLILLDVMMPGMNGFEVCQAIREDPRLSEIPIIMITALDDDESMIRGIDVGADDFLSKPINKIELRSRVRGILRLNRYRKLCDERQKFAWVVENSNHGYVVLDQALNIRFANPKAQEILRLENSQTRQINFFDQVRQHYAVKPSKSAAGDGESEPIASLDEPFLLVRAQTENSELHWIRATALELGTPSRDQSLIRLEDITQSMLSFQEKHTFARMISHKLLTPLNALKAADQLMSKCRADAERDPHIAQVFDLQKKGLSRLEYDIHSILKFLESTSHPRQEPPATRIREIARHLEEINHDMGVSLRVSMGSDIPSPAEIGISIYNFEACAREIIENAIKFHSSGSPVLECSITLLDDSRSVRFDFLNNATPLSEKELKNAWKPYWQADSYFTGEIKGMGLGLSLIATNVWTAGGTCRIANRKDVQGVSVQLVFPLVNVPSNVELAAFQKATR